MFITALTGEIPSNEISNIELVNLVKFYSQRTFNGNIRFLEYTILKLLNHIGSEGRYWRKKSEKPLDLIEKSIGSCLQNASMSKEDIDLIIFCSIDKGFIEPANGNIIASAFDFKNARCLDVCDACMGWFTSLEVVYSLLKNNCYRNALIVSSEFPMDSKGGIVPECFTIRNIKELEYKIAAMTIGECCTATIINSDNLGSFYYQYISNSKNAHLCNVPLPNFKKYIKDNINEKYYKSPLTFSAYGREMNSEGKRYAKKVVKDYIDKWGKPDVIIPHTTSARVIQSIAKELDVNDKLHLTFQYLGNTTSNSVPIGILSAYEAGKIDEKTNILGCFGGAGMKFASIGLNLKHFGGNCT